MWSVFWQGLIIDLLKGRSGCASHMHAGITNGKNVIGQKIDFARSCKKSIGLLQFATCALKL